ncbi:MAG: YheV family putative metal-binding protein [Halioglobus sp.]|nr:YheV family putative metal-binding protein [Halioglobus sp.]
MQESGKRRRFIAGAVCPRCGEMDRIVVDLDTDRRECVACSFSEARPAAVDTRRVGAGVELPTRVTRGAARRVETPAQPVTLIDEIKPRD